LEQADLYLLVAETLERSAELAEAHVERDVRTGRTNPAEVVTAQRARDAASHARELASQCAARHPAASSSQPSVGSPPHEPEGGTE
jgi:hypothetical protein